MTQHLTHARTLSLTSVSHCFSVAGKTTSSRKIKAAKTVTPTKVKAATTNATGVKPAEDKILQAMGKFRAIGEHQPTRDQVQNFSGNAKTLAGFQKNVGNLKKKGYLVYTPGNTLELTEKGVNHVGDIDPSSLTNEELHKSIKEILGSPKAGELFDMLVDGNEHNRIEIAKEMGYDLKKLSGYDKMLSKMSTLGFVEKTKTTLQLTDKCFLPGRRP